VELAAEDMHIGSANPGKQRLHQHFIWLDAWFWGITQADVAIVIENSSLHTVPFQKKYVSSWFWNIPTNSLIIF
jgi:hypothetical protein